MAVGIQPTSGALNVLMGNCVVGVRDAAQQGMQLWSFVAALGTTEAEQVAGLEALGFASAANPTNPGGVSDSQFFWTCANYIFSMCQFYYGNLASPTQFDYDSALALPRGAN